MLQASMSIVRRGYLACSEGCCTVPIGTSASPPVKFKKHNCVDPSLKDGTEFDTLLHLIHGV